MAEIEKIRADLADARERLAAAEVVVDRVKEIDLKLDKLGGVLEKIKIKQAILILKVGLAATIAATISTMVLGAIISSVMD